MKVYILQQKAPPVGDGSTQAVFTANDDTPPPAWLKEKLDKFGYVLRRHNPTHVQNSAEWDKFVCEEVRIDQDDVVCVKHIHKSDPNCEDCRIELGNYKKG